MQLISVMCLLKLRVKRNSNLHTATTSKVDSLLIYIMGTIGRLAGTFAARMRWLIDLPVTFYTSFLVCDNLLHMETWVHTSFHVFMVVENENTLMAVLAITHVFLAALDILPA